MPRPACLGSILTCSRQQGQSQPSWLKEAIATCLCCEFVGMKGSWEKNLSMKGAEDGKAELQDGG